MENPLQSSEQDGKAEMHAKILKLKDALTQQQQKNRETEIGVQRDLIRELLKSQNEAGVTEYSDLKLKDLKLKQEKDKPADDSSYYDSEYESEDEREEEVKHEEEEQKGPAPKK